MVREYQGKLYVHLAKQVNFADAEVNQLLWSDKAETFNLHIFVMKSITWRHLELAKCDIVSTVKVQKAVALFFLSSISLKTFCQWNQNLQIR